MTMTPLFLALSTPVLVAIIFGALLPILIILMAKNKSAKKSG